jgi:hypothetical protein
MEHHADIRQAMDRGSREQRCRKEEVDSKFNEHLVRIFQNSLETSALDEGLSTTLKC